MKRTLKRESKELEAVEMDAIECKTYYCSRGEAGPFLLEGGDKPIIQR
jgi:hypothetical protein